MPYTVRTIAELRELSEEETAATLTGNTIRVFGDW